MIVYCPNCGEFSVIPYSVSFPVCIYCGFPIMNFTPGSNVIKDDHTNAT